MFYPLCYLFRLSWLQFMYGLFRFSYLHFFFYGLRSTHLYLVTYILYISHTCFPVSEVSNPDNVIYKSEIRLHKRNSQKLGRKKKGEKTPKKKVTKNIQCYMRVNLHFLVTSANLGWMFMHKKKNTVFQIIATKWKILFRIVHRRSRVSGQRQNKKFRPDRDSNPGPLG